MKHLPDNNRNEEEAIRALLKKSRVAAPENLQHRIIGQVENVRALTPQQSPLEKTGTNVLADFKSIFAFMYIALIAAGASFYFSQGSESLKSPSFVFIVVGIASLFSLFWLITRLDSFLREKYRRKRKS
ncbi:MAG: hypothetical protein LBS52_05710 [Dysgonamonadaceae bacterium]|jgi:hypothetical protein|nr:hypothetical protein [Dysgonamonadaceae bacterium]